MIVCLLISNLIKTIAIITKWNNINIAKILIKKLKYWLKIINHKLIIWWLIIFIKHKENRTFF